MPVRTYSVPLDFEPPPAPPRSSSVAQEFCALGALPESEYRAANQEYLEAEADRMMRDAIAAVHAARAAHQPVQIAVVSGRGQRKPATTGFEAMFQEDRAPEELEF